jgi:hypothetical protein
LSSQASRRIITLPSRGGAEALWSRYRQEPELLEWFEYLNWLDLRLIQAVPDAVRDEYAGDQPERPEFYRVSAFSNLISLYLREGFLRRRSKSASSPSASAKVSMPSPN